MMKHLFDQYHTISFLLDYPVADTTMQLRRVTDMLEGSGPEIADGFAEFSEGYGSMEPWEREEYFVRTFEAEALTSMDLGYLLFGEEYKRGAFLALMQEEQMSAGNPLGHELADHLPNVLRLLPLMHDYEMALELCCSLIIPAIEEIIRKMEGSGNLFLLLFRVLLAMMKRDFGHLPYDRFIPGGNASACTPEGYACGFDFLDEIGKTKKS